MDYEAPVGPDPDASLVARVVEGSEDALAHLYDRFGPTVFAAARRLGADPGAAEEIVQETFMVLWNRAEAFQPGRGTVRSWLVAIARNRAIDGFRSARRRVPALPFSSLVQTDGDEASGLEWLVASSHVLAAGSPEPRPEQALSDREDRELVAAALGDLTPEESQVIGLAYRDGLSQSEIAAVLEWPLGTVKTRTRRALHRLRQVLEAGQEPERLDPGLRDPRVQGEPAVRVEAVVPNASTRPTCCSA